MQDQFSKQSKLYVEHRPTYPKELYEFLIQHVSATERVWDCATGNGQAAMALAQFFDEVIATDISKNQLGKAPFHQKIDYRLSPAEKTNFPDHHFDLITAAQAVHWFDLKKFYVEVKRVLRPGGLLAVWGYWLPRVDDQVDNVIDQIYDLTFGLYFTDARKAVDDKYDSLYFPFREIPSPTFSIRKQYDLKSFLGFFNSWSSVQKYIAEKNVNPVDIYKDDFESAWGDPGLREVVFPVFMKAGKTGPVMEQKSIDPV